MRKQKPRICGAFANSWCQKSGHACQATWGYRPTKRKSRCRTRAWAHRVPNRLDGRAEDRGIEPLRLQAAVQRLASVPSTHTGSVLRSRACHAPDCIQALAWFFV